MISSSQESVRKISSLSKMITMIIIGLVLVILPVIASEPLYLNIDTYSSESHSFNLEQLNDQIDDQKNSLLDALAYGDGKDFDEDNDGVESINGVVDIRPMAEVSAKDACLRWEIFSIEEASSVAVCHGSQACCGALNLMPARYEWTEPLYITYGSYGSSASNIISAQSVIVSEEGISYSPWKSIDASFIASIESITDAEALRHDLLEVKTENPAVEEISLKDEEGNEVVGELPEKITLEIAISESTEEVNGSVSLLPDAIVELQSIDTDQASLENIGALEVRTENLPLEQGVEALGISPSSLITIENAGQIANESSYEGKITFNSPDAFTTVLYCPDDSASSCIELKPCGQIQESCYVKGAQDVEVFIPHFSSVILGMESATINLSVTSPDNQTALANGENVSLSISTNATIILNYSLDGGAVNILGNSSSFLGVLNGSLPYGILSNGAHTLTLGIKNQFSDNFTQAYGFMVSDSSAPVISLNLTNGSAMSATYLFLSLKINSTEYGNLTYALNAQSSQSANFTANKSVVLSLSPAIGLNNLTLNSSDLHGNVASHFYQFNFSEIGSCADARQNGQESGIDCGGSCNVCIAFSASTDRSAYNLSDTAYITITSRASSIVNVTIKRNGEVTYRREFAPAIQGVPISETRTLTNTSAYGNYTINATMYYLNISEQKNATFEIVSPTTSAMSIVISANKTTIRENEEVYFGSAVTNNASAISYRWDFENDGTIDSTASNLTWRFSRNGTFRVNLTVADSLGNQTDLETITSEKTYNVTITVRDNVSQGAIQNALIEIKNEEKNTSSDGKAVFTLTDDEHDIIITHPSYRTISDDIDANGNKEFLVNLTVADRLAPILSLVSPLNNATVYNTTVEFAYSVYDTSQTSCVVYTRSESVLWRVAASSSLDRPSGTYALSADVDGGVLEWKVDCRDRDGNSNTSEIFTLHISTEGEPNVLSVDLEQKDIETGELEVRIKEAIKGLEGLSGKESDIALAIDLKKTLEKAVITIERANRDLHSLEWRKLNQSDLEKETQAILKRIEEVSEKTPKSFTLIEATEFVGYAQKPSVQEAVSIFANSSNRKITKKDMRNLLEQSEKLQSLITITTKASVVEMEYLGGDKEKFTVIDKKVGTKEQDFLAYQFFEIIPKEVAKTTTQMQIFFEHQVIKEDPVLSIDLDKVKGYAYMVQGAIPLKKTEEVASVLVKRDLKAVGVSRITGFAFAGSLASGIKETIDVRLLLEIIIIAVLVVVYLIYSFGSVEHLRQRFEPRKVRDLREKIEEASHVALGKNYEAASAQYREIAKAYGELEPEKRKKLSELVNQLLSQVNLLYINKLLAEADSIIGKKDRAEMAAIYEKIRALYKVIPKDYKAQVHKKCLELHDHLSKKEEPVKK